MKIKTFVLMVSKVFPEGHIKEGEPTGFKEAILSGEKIHTIRSNYDLWQERFRQIEEGTAVLSLREWSGKPYEKGTKQETIKTLSKKDGVGFQKIEFIDGYNYYCHINDIIVPSYNVAMNDGLHNDEFMSWFEGYDTSKPMPLIHFTPFRY